MLHIQCPYCGERPEIEFHNAGQAHRTRPVDPAALTDEEWAHYLFFRANPRGVHAEMWVHVHGCQRYFNALRDTVSDCFLATYAIGAPEPGHVGQCETGKAGVVP